MESFNPSVFIRAIFAFVLSIPLALTARAQQAASATDPEQPQRPRIGLALSGGGALGLAEVGIIQWMEEHHIPVDRIAGTSMGSIIGSMYATGMTPDQIRDFALKVNWEEALLPEPVYRDLP